MRLLALVLAFGLAAGNAAAQADEWTGIGFLNVNGGYQIGNRDFEVQLLTDLYDEAAEYTSEHTSTGNGIVDITAGFRLWRGLALALNFTSFNTTGSAQVTGAVPHPLFFNRPRSVMFELTDLSRRELGYHVQAYYLIPLTERFSVALFGGPSLIRLQQDVVSEVGIAEMGPPFSDVDVTAISTAIEKGTGFGGSVGADLSYRFTPVVGAGFFLKYVGGSVDLVETEDGGSVGVGGMQLGGGLRIFF